MPRKPSQLAQAEREKEFLFYLQLMVTFKTKCRCRSINAGFKLIYGILNEIPKIFFCLAKHDN